MSLTLEQKKGKHVTVYEPGPQSFLSQRVEKFSGQFSANGKDFVIHESIDVRYSIDYQPIPDVIAVLQRAAKGMADAKLSIEALSDYDGATVQVNVEGTRIASQEEYAEAEAALEELLQQEHARKVQAIKEAEELLRQEKPEALR